MAFLFAQQPSIQLWMKPCFFTTTPTFDLWVQVPNLVGNIRQRVSWRMGIPIVNIGLSIRGTMLQNDDDLSAHNIVHGDTIEVWFRGDCCETPRLSEEVPRGLGGAMRALSQVAVA